MVMQRKGFIISCFCIILVSKFLVGEIEAPRIRKETPNLSRISLNSSPNYKNLEQDEEDSNVGYGAIGEGDPMRCKPNDRECQKMQQANKWQRGCNEATECRGGGHPKP